jgi:GTP-binding protein
MGFLMAIVGRPNVGKSTLFNRLSKSRRAIVDDEPGVTRDRNYTQITFQEKTFTLVDTGGFEPLSSDPILSQMREQAILAMEEADGIVFLTDGREGLTPGDQDVFNLLRASGKPVIVAVNKVDGPEHEDLVHDFYALGADTILFLSAAHGYGVPTLLETIADLLPETTGEEGLQQEFIRLAIIGRPNVGKSSLINCILGEKRLLVSEVPGTTRDTIDSVVTVNDKRYILTDTAGIRRKSRVNKKLETFSIVRALKGIEHCHIALLVLDASEGVTDQDVKIAGHAFERGRAVIVLLNKWDLVPFDMQKKNPFLDDIERRMKYLNFAPVLTISALTGKRVPRIFDVVQKVYSQYTARVPTGALNRVLSDAVSKHTLPRHKNLPVKLNYITQVSIKPPTFAVFANRPEGVHFSYRRYLINRIRDQFELDSTPVRLVFRSKSEDRRKGRKS